MTGEHYNDEGYIKIVGECRKLTIAVGDYLLGSKAAMRVTNDLPNELIVLHDDNRWNRAGSPSVSA